MKSALLILALFATISCATSIRTVVANGNTYFAAENNGTIEPNTFFNRTTLFNGQNITDALSRSWFNLDYSLAYVSGGVITKITAQGLPSFNIYGYSDNSTYWRGEINRSFTLGARDAQVSLNYRQNTFDDYINETWRLTLNASYTAPNPVWYVESLINISYLDTVQWSKGNAAGGQPLSTDASYDNLSMVGIVKFNGKGWTYILPANVTNKVLVRNGNVHIGMLLGKTLVGTTVFGLQKIDATCSLTCNPPDSLYILWTPDQGFSPYNATPQTPVNWTVNMSVRNLVGTTCTISNDCQLNLQAYDPYSADVLGNYKYKTVDNVQGDTWLHCLSTRYPGSPDNCTTIGSQTVAGVKPVSKNVEYTFQLSQDGTYAISPIKWRHYLQGAMLPVLTTAAFIYNGTDLSTPNSTFPFANGSTINLAPTNGSLLWVNYTLQCNFNDELGLINTTGIWDNNSGGRTLTVNNSNDWVAVNQTRQITVGQGKRGFYCCGSNTTARVATSGLGTNWTTTAFPKACEDFVVNIVASSGRRFSGWIVQPFWGFPPFQGFIMFPFYPTWLRRFR